MFRSAIPLLVLPLAYAIGCEADRPADTPEGLGASGSPREEAPFWPDPGPDATPKVLVFGVDGVRPDVLTEVATPNLDALATTGSFSDQATTRAPTVSGPGWSSMLTGVWPEKHGVLSNDFASNRYDEYPDFLTRLEKVRPELRTFVAADWLPLVTGENGGPLISNAVDHKVVLDGYELGWAQADSLVVAAAVEEIQRGDPDALFVYVGAPDEISHEIGGIGEAYRRAIATADDQLGGLVRALRNRTTFHEENWLVLVSTDHGRTAEGAHGGESPEETRIFFLASGPGAVRGGPTAPPAIVDVAVTALAHLGIPMDPEWELDGEAVALGGSTSG